MGAPDLILELRQKGYSIFADGGFLDISPAEIPGDLLQKLIAEKSGILRELEKEQAANDLNLMPFNPAKDLGDGWIIPACFQCQNCKRSPKGGSCAGNRPDLPLKTALLRVLPADKGERCNDFKGLI